MTDEPGGVSPTYVSPENFRALVLIEAQRFARRHYRMHGERLRGVPDECYDRLALEHMALRASHYARAVVVMLEWVHRHNRPQLEEALTLLAQEVLERGEPGDRTLLSTEGWD